MQSNNRNENNKDCDNISEILNSTIITRDDYANKKIVSATGSRKQKTHRGNGQGVIRYRKDRKNPYMALVCVDFFQDANGKKQCQYKSIGSFHTRLEADKALAEYISDPITISSRIKTFRDLYYAWYQDYSNKGFSENYLRSIKSAFAYCNSIYDVLILNIGPGHIKDVMYHGYIIEKHGKNKGKRKYATDSTKERIKSLCNLMFDYAVERNLVRRNPSRMFDVNDILERIYLNQKKKKPFSSSQVRLMWDNLYEIDNIDMVLIGLYTGFRPQELCLLKVSNIDFDNKTIVGGMKTESGKDRIVPIHPMILPLVKARVGEAINVYQRDTLFNITNVRGKRCFSYDLYRHKFAWIMNELGFEGYSPHCTRHTFATQAELCGLRQRAIKLIMGHSQKMDVTNDVYIHTNASYLYNEMLKYGFEGDEEYE